MRDIDPQKIEDQELDWFEWKYLKDRMRLPAGYPEPERPEEEPEDFPKASRIQPLEEQDSPEFLEETELETEPADPKGTPLEEQDSPTIQAAGGIVDEDDDEEADYAEKPWNNDKRRAELSRRGLSVTGGKEDLVARLRRSDAGELLDEDQVEESDED